MKLTIIPALILSLAFAVSCSNSSEHKHDSSTTETTAEEQQAEDPQANAEIKLSLNNGAKWNSDESTYTGMQRLEMTLTNFKNDNEDPSSTDYNKLGNALANINKDIISQCSMKGEDHDQLHVLLAPMLANVDVIKNGQDLLEIKVNTEELNEAVVQFFKHFEVY